MKRSSKISSIHTCYAEDDASEGKPRVLLVPRKVIDDILRIEGSDHGGIVLDEVKNSDSAYGDEPKKEHRSKTVANFVCSKSLKHEEKY